MKMGHGFARLSRPGSSYARWITLALGIALAFTGSAWPQTIRNPRRIAAGPHGQVLVTDRLFGAVVAVDKESLQPVWRYELPEEGAPFGLATWGRLVYVGNTKTMNVEVYRMQGPRKGNMNLKFRYNLGHSPPGKAGFIKNPIDIAVDPKAGLVFVLDSKEKQIKIFNLNGTFVAAFFPTDEFGQLLSPVSLAVDETRQEVLVGDYGDPSGWYSISEPARILIYNYDGELLFQINGNGSTHETTKFARVQGMATSPDGRIFAADPLGSRILVLDRSSGALIDEVGTEGDQPGQLRLPLDVVRDEKTGDLFVTNNQGARRVEVFRAAGW